MELKQSEASKIVVPPLKAIVELVNEKIRFRGISGDNEPISIDYSPPFGDNHGYKSLELFLVSLSSCVGSSVLILLRRMNKTVTACSIRSTGYRRDQHPTCFEKIILTLSLESPDIVKADVEKAIALSESNLCPVWAMVKGNVEIATEIELN
jgi:putative redox protein